MQNKLRIAVVEDEEFFLNDLVNSLKECDRTAEVAGFLFLNDSVLSSIIEFQPDIVFSDISMPRMDGLEMIKRLKEKLFNTRYVLISGFMDFEYAKQGIHLGVKEYLSKPVECEQLKSVLDSIMMEIAADKTVKIHLDYGERNPMVIISGTEKSGKNSTAVIAEAAKKLFDTDCQARYTINGLASDFHVTPKHFIAVFKKTYGVSPLHYLQTVRIEKAKEILRSRDVTTENVAHSVGYDDVAYFFRIFKKTVGMSPGEFRKYYDSGLQE